ncbi:ribosome biogenesis factor YjgA [uncultured Pseudodesulfovibrio sp.]|uniref:ribosome biogenesis factor YjgA n=1 Tax=uncultured Pseudodesulfovibrio sp. TaxID=2035858 RepID=UPI0029C7845E|nr:ribosome biogenesis factor YjgA [uncultured Pseudodesulfovibrio sp.]
MAKKKPTYLPSDFDEIDDRPSRSQLKRDMTALQQLGADLAALGDKVVKEAGLPPEVEKALLLIKTMTKHEAKRRHMQYVGKLMRTFDTTHVNELVDAAHLGHEVKTKAFRRIEDLRDRLLDGDDDLLQSLFDSHPEEGQRLRQLTLGARREKANSKPPKDTRALFRLLREIEGEE